MLIALAFVLPASAQSVELDRADLCDRIGGEWDSGSQTCKKFIEELEIEELRIKSIESDRLVQVEAYIPSQGWTCPMFGELYVYTLAGDFARAPLPEAVEVYGAEDTDIAAEKLELERTENVFEHAIDAMQ